MFLTKSLPSLKLRGSFFPATVSSWEKKIPSTVTRLAFGPGAQQVLQKQILMAQDPLCLKQQSQESDLISNQ